MKSYVNVRKRVIKSYRADLSRAKREEEIKNAFSKVAASLLSEAMGRDIREEEVKLDVTSKSLFSLGKYEKSKELGTIMRESDLRMILEKMATEAKNRIVHIRNDNDKTSMFNRKV